MNALQRCLGLSVALLLVSPASAVPEHQFEQEFTKRVMPEFWATGESGWLTAADGMQIHYRKYLRPLQDSALIISPGRTEGTFKYAELIHDLQDLNLAIFIIDHRGQGASGRETPEREMQYVADFSAYKDDLNQLMKEVVEPLGFKRHYALGHSMGANILALYMVQNPKVFAKFVASSPMLDLSPSPFVFQRVAHAFASLMCWLGYDKTFVFGNGPYQLNESYRGTGSAVRFQAFKELRVQRPEERVGGVSWRFAQKALVATWDMRRDAEKLIMPILMLQSGNDDVVLTGGQDYVCQRAKQCKKISFPEARHELHIETDNIRDVWLSSIRGFLTNP